MQVHDIDCLLIEQPMDPNHIALLPVAKAKLANFRDYPAVATGFAIAASYSA